MKFILTAFTVISLALVIAGCGGGEPGTATKHNATYTGSGSVWTWTLRDDGTFTAIRKATSASTDNELDISGTYEGFSTGFYKFTVGTVAGTVVADYPPVGAQAGGFAVPGVILIVKPIGDGRVLGMGRGDDDIMVMPVLSGTCPSTDVTFNWVQVSPGDTGDLSDNDLWGNATLPFAGGPITGQNWTMASGAATSALTGGTVAPCVDGKYALSRGRSGFVAMTEGGVGIVNTENDNAIVALPRQTDGAEATVRGKDYVGLVFNESSRNTQPINITFPASGDATFTMLTDAFTGAVGETGPVTIVSAGTGEQAGFLKLQANAATDTSPPTMWGAVASVSGHTVMIMAGFNQDGVNNDEGFSVVLVSK